MPRENIEIQPDRDYSSHSNNLKMFKPKRIMKKIVILLIMLAASYAGGAFITWSFNPADWHEEGRAYMLIFPGIIWLLWIVAGYLDEKL